MKRILPALLALFILLTLPAYAASGKLTATAAESGDKVTVTVRLDNPGIVATRIFVRYDSGVLQLTEAKNGEVFPSGTFGKNVTDNPYTMLWDESLRRDNNTTSGTLCVLTFDIKGGTETGTTSVRIAVDKASTFDVDLNSVTVADGSCSVSVPTVTTKAGTAATTEKTTAAAKPTLTPSLGTTKAPAGTSAATTTKKQPAVTTTKLTAATTKPAAATTKPAAATTKPAAATTKPAASAVGTTEKTSAFKMPSEVASAVSAAASSAIEKASSAAANVPSTAAQSAETKPAVDPNGTTDPASGETASDVLTADGTLPTVPETLQEAISDPAPSANHRGLLWLLLLIPVAVAVVLIVRKKKS